jgi:hypothetical protein
VSSLRLRLPVRNEKKHGVADFYFSFLIDCSITGTIPSMFCGDGPSSLNMLYREFGCDAVLCRPGTFNIHGHATLYSACRSCPTTDVGELKSSAESTILGRISCPGTEFVHGDLNGDGILSPREVLRMIYIDNLGKFWGPTFQPWADTNVNECDLIGITCVKGKIAKIDLTNANLCSNGDRKAGPIQYCKGLPAEIGEISSLEILQLSRRQFLRGSLPTEVGKLSKLRLLDLSSCPFISGTLPTEIALLTNLKVLVVSYQQDYRHEMIMLWYSTAKMFYPTCRFHIPDSDLRFRRGSSRSVRLRNSILPTMYFPGVYRPTSI